eukprot:6634781-Karenia_brevis.AAC.1
MQAVLDKNFGEANRKKKKEKEKEDKIIQVHDEEDREIDPHDRWKREHWQVLLETLDECKNDEVVDKHESEVSYTAEQIADTKRELHSIMDAKIQKVEWKLTKSLENEDISGFIPLWSDTVERSIKELADLT